MKRNKKGFTTTNFYHKSADALIKRRIPEIQEDIRVFSQDLAHQSRPIDSDSSLLFMPKIQSAYDVLLEQVFKLIGYLSVINQTALEISEMFQREKQSLKKKRSKIQEQARILRKDIKGLTDISHAISNWKYKWRLVLLVLSAGEVAINYKIFLLLTPNMITALIASIGLCTVLFVIAHSFKDVLTYFKTKKMKWIVGSSIVIGSLLLLYNLNTIRVLYMENQGQVVSSYSKWSFLAINFCMLCVGMLI